jgi:hypothetical protein
MAVRLRKQHNTFRVEKICVGEGYLLPSKRCAIVQFSFVSIRSIEPGAWGQLAMELGLQDLKNKSPSKSPNDFAIKNR